MKLTYSSLSSREKRDIHKNEGKKIRRRRRKERAKEEKKIHGRRVIEVLVLFYSHHCFKSSLSWREGRGRKRRRRRALGASKNSPLPPQTTRVFPPSSPPSSEEGGPFVFATTEASSCWSSPPPSSGEEEDEGDNEGIVSFSSFRNHSVGNPEMEAGTTLFRMSVAKLPEVKSQL